MTEYVDRPPEVKELLRLLPGDIVRRMHNWVHWKGSGQFRGTASFSSDYGRRFDRYPSSSMPIITAEAQETDACIEAVPQTFGDPIKLFWLSDTDMSFRAMGEQLGITHPTVKARLEIGHFLLVVEIYRRRSARSHAVSPWQCQMCGNGDGLPQLPPCPRCTARTT